MARHLFRGALLLSLSSLILTACGGTSGSPWVPRLSWTKMPQGVNPPGRVSAAMAYDAATNQVLVFGGKRNPATDVVGDTWTWNGARWREQHPAASPPALSGAAMAYDAATRQLVLFGGARRRAIAGIPLHYSAVGPPLAATWTWNGATWTEQHPAVSPSARKHVAMAYDPATREVVLFGGFGSKGRPLRDTWTWNGATWTEQHPAVSPSSLPYPLEPAQLMAYDPANREIVLFEYMVGGAHGPKGGSTWTWNGSAWTEQHPSATPSMPCWGGALSETPVRGVLMLAGRVCTSKNPRLWFWNGKTWYGAAPPEKGLPTVMYDTYDSSLRTIVVQEETLPRETGSFVAQTWLVEISKTESRR